MNILALFETKPTLQNDNFKIYVLVSVALHLSFVLLMVIKNFISPSQTIDFARAIRVDMVALPEKYNDTKEAAPSTTPDTPVIKEKAKAADKSVALKPEKSVALKPEKVDQTESLKASQKRALEKLKALEAIEKLKGEVSQREAKANQTKGEAVKAPPYKGQVISSGSSFTGLSKLRVNDYLDNLTRKVRDHWELPQWLSNANLKAVVIVSVDARGYVVKNTVETSSGNSVFDASCVAAVKNAEPFDPPPEEVQEAFLLIRFPFQ